MIIKFFSRYIPNSFTGKLDVCVRCVRYFFAFPINDVYPMVCPCRMRINFAQCIYKSNKIKHGATAY